MQHYLAIGAAVSLIANAALVAVLLRRMERGIDEAREERLELLTQARVEANDLRAEMRAGFEKLERKFVHM